MNNETASKIQFSGIFILSTPRSGSSLLRYILDTHPRLCCPGELNLGLVCEHLYRAAFYTIGQVGGSDLIDQMARADVEVQRVVNGLMTSYAKLKGKQIWCEKTPRNTRHLELLKRLFPDAVYICLYRHCMDTVYSHLESGRFGFMEEVWEYVRRYPDNLTTAMVESWVDQVREIMKFEQANRNKCYRIKYESLVLAPEETLRPLFSFLGLEWPADLLENVFRSQHDAGPGDIKIEFSKSIHEDSLGKGASVERSEIHSELLEKMNAILKGLDYPEVGPDWNHTPRAPRPSSPRTAQTLSGQRISSVHEVFTMYLPQQLENSSESLRDLAGVLKFVINGQNGCAWRIDLTQKPGEIKYGDGAADCVIKVSGGDLINIVNGESSVGECFLQGRLQATGDVRLGVAFGRIAFGA